MADTVKAPSTMYGSNYGTQTGANPESIARDIDLIKSNKFTKIIITPTLGSDVTGADANNTAIECWGEADVSIGGSSQWNSAFEDALAAGITRDVSGLVNRFGGDSVPTFTVQTRQQTVKSWSGSSPLMISMDLYFVATDAAHDVRMDAVRALNMIYPIQSSKDATLIFAPLGHKATLASKGGQGLMSIKIGQWFESSAYFLCEMVDNAFAMKPTQTGNPLYVKMRLHFTTSELITIKEIRQWLKQETGTPTINLGYSELGSRGAQQLGDVLYSAVNWTKNQIFPGSTPQVGSSSPSPLPSATDAPVSGSPASIATSVWSRSGGVSI